MRVFQSLASLHYPTASYASLCCILLIFLTIFFSSFCPWPELCSWPFFFSDINSSEEKEATQVAVELNVDPRGGGQRFYLSLFKASSLCKLQDLWRANWLLSACDRVMRLACKITGRRNKRTLLLHYIIRKAHRQSQTHYSLTDKCCIIALMSHEMSVTDLAFHQRLVCLCKWGDSCSDIQYRLAVSRY